jgi:hypothetical protein
VSNISPETVVARQSDALTATVDDDMVMLDLRGSRYFGLDRVGRRIWELLEQPRSVQALCATLEGEFEVSTGTCHDDVVPFLEQLADAQLIELR